MNFVHSTSKIDLSIYAQYDGGPDYMQGISVDFEMNPLLFATLKELQNDNSLNSHATRHLTSDIALTCLIDALEEGKYSLLLSRRLNKQMSAYVWRLNTEETVINEIQAPVFLHIMDHLLSLPPEECNYMYVQDLIKVSDSHEYRAMLWFAQRMMGVNVDNRLFVDGLWNGNQHSFADFVNKAEAAIEAGYLPNSNPNALFDPVYVSSLVQMYSKLFKQIPHLLPFTLQHKPTAYFESDETGKYVLPCITTAFMKYTPEGKRVERSDIVEMVSNFHKN